MLNLLRNRKHDYYFLFLFLLNIILEKSNYITFPLSTFINKEEFKPLSINDKNTGNVVCKYWIPSLLYPTLLVDPEYEIGQGLVYLKRKFKTFCPAILMTEELEIYLYENATFNENNLILSKIRNIVPVDDCFFGLAQKGNYDALNESEINLIKLKNDNRIEKKIFSFDKWNIKKETITSNLYLGDIHQNFTSNNGIVANCTVTTQDWGCSFKQMNFNNKIIELTMDNGTYYKIYFSSENHKIIFPESFREKFNKTTNQVCQEDKKSEGISCPNLFDSSQNFIPLKLINENMTITTQIDNLLRFNSSQEDNKKTRITFENIECFILPLIMFKQFHVQFDLDNNIISFFTTDKSILELMKKEEDPGRQDENESSNTGTVLLIIFIIIILILLLGFGVFWFIKKKRASAENINKYNKFDEDEQNFQNMNEKVF